MSAVACSLCGMDRPAPLEEHWVTLAREMLKEDHTPALTPEEREEVRMWLTVAGVPL